MMIVPTALGKINRVLKKNRNEFSPEIIEALSFETPYFLFSKKKIVANYKEYKKLFPNSSIHYAIKANSEPEILALLDSVGCGFEIASLYELEILKKLNVKAEKIIYGTSVKPIDHIKSCFKYGVNRFACDSFVELEKIAAAAPGAKVFIRALVNDSASVFKFSEKFGVDVTDVVPLLLKARELGLHPYGISFHVGSQASDSMAWANAVKTINPVIKELQTQGIKIDVLNIGGGFPCNYMGSTVPTLDEIAKNTLKEVGKLPFRPHLILEPGRGMIANTAILVATIIARIERKENTWLFLDAGVYNGLFEAMAYQGSTRYPITSVHPPQGSGESLFAVAGPTGDSPDILTKEALLPQDVAVGEKLIIHHVGAYSLVVTSQFNGFPKPNVYFL